MEQNWHETSPPLAERMRPTSLDDFAGQQHLLGTAMPLRRAIEGQYLYSCIFWGPPGVGKTTLAQLLAKNNKLPYFQLSAINAGVKDLREIIEKVKKDVFLGKQGKAVLFIDEIHRFNKSQQDALLEAVEKGLIILIGATTENPSFEVNNALLSRCEVYNLKPLTLIDLQSLAQKAIENDAQLKQKQIEINDWDALLQISGGDARKLLNAIELISKNAPSNVVTITNDLVAEMIQKKAAMFDKNGEMHYDIISAMIKSIRGSDPNAAIYYLARLIDGGEDPKFIARRLLVLASEDIGLANPNALLLADACFRAVSVIGYPECRINLSQTVIYLATCSKSNSAYKAIDAALDLVQKTGDLPVPLHLRNAPTPLMKKMGYGKGYKYAHDFENNFVNQEFLPAEIEGSVFYKPSMNASEQKIKESLIKNWGDKYQGGVD